jgi:hypothetical protein
MDLEYERVKNREKKILQNPEWRTFIDLLTASILIQKQKQSNGDTDRFPFWVRSPRGKQQWAQMVAQHLVMDDVAMDSNPHFCKCCHIQIAEYIWCQHPEMITSSPIADQLMDWYNIIYTPDPDDSWTKDKESITLMTDALKGLTSYFQPILKGYCSRSCEEIMRQKNRHYEAKPDPHTLQGFWLDNKVIASRMKCGVHSKRLSV